LSVPSMGVFDSQLCIHFEWGCLRASTGDSEQPPGEPVKVTDSYAAAAQHPARPRAVDANAQLFQHLKQVAIALTLHGAGAERFSQCYCSHRELRFRCPCRHFLHASYPYQLASAEHGSSTARRWQSKRGLFPLCSIIVRQRRPVITLKSRLHCADPKSALRGRKARSWTAEKVTIIVPSECTASSDPVLRRDDDQVRILTRNPRSAQSFAPAR
jgi:hypothetical protein